MGLGKGGWMSGWKEGKMDGWVKGWMDGWTDGRRQEWMNAFMHAEGVRPSYRRWSGRLQGLDLD